MASFYNPMAPKKYASNGPLITSSAPVWTSGNGVNTGTISISAPAPQSTTTTGATPPPVDTTTQLIENNPSSSTKSKSAPVISAPPAPAAIPQSGMTPDKLASLGQSGLAQPMTTNSLGKPTTLKFNPLIGSMSGLAQQQLNDPSHGYNYDQQNKQSLQSYDVNAAKSLDAVRQKLQTSGGIANQQLIDSALNNALNRSTLDAQNQAQAHTLRSQDISNALTGGQQATTAENNNLYADIASNKVNSDTLSNLMQAEKDGNVATGTVAKYINSGAVPVGFDVEAPSPDELFKAQDQNYKLALSFFKSIAPAKYIDPATGELNQAAIDFFNENNMKTFFDQNADGTSGVTATTIDNRPRKERGVI